MQNKRTEPERDQATQWRQVATSIRTKNAVVKTNKKPRNTIFFTNQCQWRDSVSTSASYFKEFIIIIKSKNERKTISENYRKRFHIRLQI